MSTVLSSTDSSQILTTLAQNSAGARFNLAFNSLQNAYVERYNKEMEVVNRQAMDKYDTSLDAELAKLEEQLPKLEAYQTTVSSALAQATERLDDLGTLQVDNAMLQLHAAAGETTDATDFNSAVDSLNDMLSRLPIMDGSEFSIFTDEGVGDARLNGIGVNHFSVDDDTAETGSSYELEEGMSKVNLLVTKLYNHLDMVGGEVDTISDRIDTIKDLQENSVEDIKAGVQKIAEEKKAAISAQLQALSVVFETSQQSTAKMLEAMNSDGSTTQEGTAVDIFA